MGMRIAQRFLVVEALAEPHVAARLAWGFARASVAILVLTAIPLSSARFRIRYATTHGRKHLFLKDIATYYGMSYRRSGKRSQLISKYSKLSFEQDKSRATIRGVVVHLSHPVAVWKRNAVISNTDFHQLVDPIMRPAALSQRSATRVLLDPGHGGRDPGCTVGKVREKDLALNIATATARILRAKGYVVAYTRSSDRSLSLTERTRIATKWKADIFISIHANYVGVSSVAGVETFCLCPKDTPSTYRGKTCKKKCLGHAYNKLNARLAFEVQKQVRQSTAARDRGVKHASFLVLRNAPCPAVLVETGYLSNATERTKLASAAYQTKIAKGIAAGVVNYRAALAKGKKPKRK